MKNAFDAVDFARKLDLADRYLNNKAVRYALLCDDVQNSEKIMKLIMKYEVDTNVYEL